ncbi:hypothetical protein EI94DRAFT_1705573 [Lactarius quietus]|nr:hypothetical protein EI94DRAFT_1705573 [Lactarius quietus]
MTWLENNGVDGMGKSMSKGMSKERNERMGDNLHSDQVVDEWAWVCAGDGVGGAGDCEHEGIAVEGQYGRVMVELTGDSDNAKKEGGTTVSMDLCGGELKDALFGQERPNCYINFMRGELDPKFIAVWAAVLATDWGPKKNMQKDGSGLKCVRRGWKHYDRSEVKTLGLNERVVEMKEEAVTTPLDDDLGQNEYKISLHKP